MSGHWQSASPEELAIVRHVAADCVTAFALAHPNVPMNASDCDDLTEVIDNAIWQVVNRAMIKVLRHVATASADEARQW